MKRRALLQATLAAMPLATARAQGGTPEAARREGRVTWYTSLLSAQGARPLAAAFEARYPGIKVDVVSGTNDDLVLKLLAEGRSGRINADVSHGGSALIPAKKAGLVEPYASPAAAAYPPEYRDPGGFWAAQDVLFLGTSVNTDLVAAADIPTTPGDLLAPRWRGRMAWCSQLSQGGPPGYIGAVLLGMGQEAGLAHLRALAQQKVVNVVGNQRVVLDQVVVGQYPLALMTFNHHAALSAGDGAPVRWLPVSPVVTNLDTVFLLKNAPHPNAGRLFIDYLLSDEGQAIFRAAGYIPAAPAIGSRLPGLKPEAGGFNPLVISPDLVDRHMADWIALYRELFV